MESPCNGIPSPSILSLETEVMAILSGLLGGLHYGLKIRAPHAFVMTFLFRRDQSTRDKLKMIVRSTCQHSATLGSFAALYKSILFVLKWVSVRMRQIAPDASRAQRGYIIQRMGQNIAFWLLEGTNKGRRLVPRPAGYPERIHHAVVAGAVGGYVIWGKNTAINNQIVLYLTSRVLSGMASLAREKGIHPFSWNSMDGKTVYPWKAAVVWGIVMGLYEAHPYVLQSSLKKSMDEIYRRGLSTKTRGRKG